MPIELATMADRAERLAASRQQARRVAQQARQDVMEPSLPLSLRPDALPDEEEEPMDGGGRDEGSGQQEAGSQEPDAAIGRGMRGVNVLDAAGGAVGIPGMGFATEAKRLMGRYKIRMQFLEEDIKAEKKGMSSTFFFPIGLVGFSTVEIIGVVTGGTVATILNWILYPIVLIITIYRAYRYLSIRYRDPKRQINRGKKLVSRSIFRQINKALFSVIELIPVLNMIPSWVIPHVAEQWLGIAPHEKKLKKLEHRCGVIKRGILRRRIRARSPQAKYDLAVLANRLVERLEARFDAI